MYKGRVLAGMIIGFSTLAYLCIGGIFGIVVFSFGFLGVIYSNSELYETNVLNLDSIGWKEPLGIILCNLIGIALVALMFRGAGIGISAAGSLISGHLDTPILRTLLRGILSGLGIGILMWIYKKKESIPLLVLGIVAILACSLPLVSAELVCVFLAGILSWKVVLYIVILFCGYNIGGILRKIIIPDQKW